MTEIVLSAMTADEARQCINDINNGLITIRIRLLDLYEREGWKVLGYASWRDCAMKEFKSNQSRVYQLLEAAEIQRDISDVSTIVETSDISRYEPIPESHLRPLADLTAPERREVWRQATATAPNGKVTAAHVEAIKTDYLHRSQPARTYDAAIPAFTPPAKSTDEHRWSTSETERKNLVEQGHTVHANMKTDLALIEWAKSQSIFSRVDRATEWGNPFHLPDDGDRATVLENYRWYLERKPSLLTKIHLLRGRVLGCWCHPEPCHAGILEEYANSND